jgi:8-oxo-dGTP diphosphatase
MQPWSNPSPPHDPPDPTPDFGGVKVALLLGDHILAIQRDQKPGLRYAGLWDLPGGGREGQETPLQTATREVQEELGFTLETNALLWSKTYPANADTRYPTCFMVLAITQPMVNQISFGTEGQRWQLYRLGDFMESDQVIPFLKSRLAAYLQAADQLPH